MKTDRRGALGLGAISVIASGGIASAQGSGAAVIDLQVCGLSNPADLLALGGNQPRFSWKLASPAAGLFQTAYRVTVARSAEDLAAGRNLVWDSGRIASQATTDIAYRGPAIPSRTRSWWQVQSWIKGGAQPLTSRAAFWETGLISPADWSADWLACEPAVARLDRQAGLHWIEGSTAPNPNQARYFRTVINAPKAQNAELLISAHELQGVWLNGQLLKAEQDDPVSWTTMSVFPLRLRRGANVLSVEIKRRTGFGVPGSALAAIIRMGPRLERRLTSATGWTTSLVAAPDWRTNIAAAEGWEPAVAAKRKPRGEPWPTYPAMLLRREFAAARKVRSARLYATALGVYEAWINGRRVGDAMMAPQSTDPSKRVLYQAYDVTDLIRPGANALGLWVGDGWYGSEFSADARFSFGPAPCRVRAQLELTFDDGSVERIETGKGWTTAPSPILTSEIYDGEVYDARLEQSGWATAGFRSAGWFPADTAEAPSVPVEPQLSPHIRITEVLKPVAVTQPRPGIYVVDFGQNFAGWPRLRVSGPAGQRIEMRFAEVLKANGEVDQSNLRTALARDVYILKGGEEEVWTPRFTYHGFRYVELHGLAQPPSPRTLEGLVGHVDLPATGAFRIGDPVVQKFWRNSAWSQKSNFFGLPTDCPQRDERLGWMGDAEVFWPAAAYNMDIQAYTSRIMGDVRRSQGNSGGFPDVIPPFGGFTTSSPGWADAGVILPYTSWRQYDDTGVIAENWDAMERYLGWLLRNNPNHLWQKSRGADYGDWLAVDAKNAGDPTTPKELIGTAYWAADAMMMAEMATAIGRTADANRYRTLFDRSRTAFLAQYVKPDGTIGNGSQTSYILPIRFGLLSPAAKAEAGRRLAADIVRRGNKLSTGFLGTPHILDALAESGQQDVAISLLLQRGYPSWGYMVEKGATTMWERWNSDTGDVGMNSYNHYAFGAIGSFLFRRVAGIDAVEPGFRRVRIAPIFDRRLRHSGADYQSSAGLIRTDWAYDGGRVRLDVMLPPNVTGDIVLPPSAATATLNGQRTNSRAARKTAGGVEIPIGPGKHRVIARV